jgi:hypothetical protein
MASVITWHRSRLALGLAFALLALLICACDLVDRSKDKPAEAIFPEPIADAPQPDRRGCAEIRGTEYRSDAERTWYFANCSGNSARGIVSPAPVRTCGAPTNPFGFDFCAPGTNVSLAPPGFCSYFRCVSGFDRGTGYVTQCVDGMFSKTGGMPDVCARHAGELRALLAH